MNVGFDLDGVVLQQNQAVFDLIRRLPEDDEKVKAYRYYCSQHPTNFNPLDYLGPNDQGFFISARGRHEADLTEAWAKHYYPSIKLVLTSVFDLSSQWQKQISASDAKRWAIEDLEIDVYFEDSPEIVKQLREKCVNCKIVHYGGRIL